MIKQDMFAIYQLKPDGAGRHKLFLNYRWHVATGSPIVADEYACVYASWDPSLEDAPEVALEKIFYLFNWKPPADYHVRSVSVSDVIVLRQKGVTTAWFVDTFGFKELKHFKKEDPRHVR